MKLYYSPGAGALASHITVRELNLDVEVVKVDVQTHVANALVQLNLMDSKYGVDVLHIAHHGSESSTSAAYFNAS